MFLSKTHRKKLAPQSPFKNSLVLPKKETANDIFFLFLWEFLGPPIFNILEHVRVTASDSNQSKIVLS